MATRASPGHPGWFSALRRARVLSGALADATTVCHDSRAARSGAVFVAMRGLVADGNAFIPDAIARGARFVVVQEGLRASWEPHITAAATFVAVPDARIALAQAAAGFYGHPARTIGTVGVTGTDGKTTTTHLVAHVLNENGFSAGYLSSVEFAAGGVAELNASHMTTLEANEIQRHLAKIRDAGGRCAVIEASSIGLDMHRVDMCEFDVGVFTNLAPDHLDYHRSIAAYRDAKAILFSMLGKSTHKGFAKAAVLNAGDPVSDELRAITSVPVISYGIGPDADVMAAAIVPDGFCTKFTARMGGESVALRTGLMGGYNVENCLAAVAVAVSQGIPFAAAARALESFPGVPGRMELIDAGQLFRVVVDIASTEQAMRNVLEMLRQATDGKLIVVFGAAGERDVARREGIARAVAEVADFAVVTNEDPRSEDPQAIANEIAAALRAHGFDGKFEQELDRRRAIETAFNRAGPSDTVLLAGKGTEQSIVIGSAHNPWDERQVARDLLVHVAP